MIYFVCTHAHTFGEHSVEGFERQQAYILTDVHEPPQAVFTSVARQFAAQRASYHPFRQHVHANGTCGRVTE
jgi:hypothetical protein